MRGPRRPPSTATWAGWSASTRLASRGWKTRPTAARPGSSCSRAEGSSATSTTPSPWGARTGPHATRPPAEAAVTAQQITHAIDRDRFHRAAGAGHGRSAEERVEDGLFRGLEGGLEERGERVARHQGGGRRGGSAVAEAQRGRERDRVIAAAVRVGGAGTGPAEEGARGPAPQVASEEPGVPGPPPHAGA